MDLILSLGSNGGCLANHFAGAEILHVDPKLRGVFPDVALDIVVVLVEVVEQCLVLGIVAEAVLIPLVQLPDLHKLDEVGVTQKSRQVGITPNIEAHEAFQVDISHRPLALRCATHVGDMGKS